MPDIQAFRGIRYDLGHVGSLSDVLCPSFEQCTPARQGTHYKRHPANAIRLVDNREELGDSEGASMARAAKFFRNWQRQGVLMQDAQPAIYVCHQHYQWGGQDYVRKGFLCRSRLETLNSGNLGSLTSPRCAEATPIARRAELRRRVEADLCPVLGLYADDDQQVQACLEEAIIEVAPREATDQAGVTHRIWPVTDLAVINNVTANMVDKRLSIAAGRATLEAALRVRDESPAALSNAEHPLQYILTMCVGLSDPGLQLAPVCQVVDGEPRDSRSVIAELSACFAISTLPEVNAQAAWEAVQAHDDQGVLAIYCPGDDQWLLAEANDAGRTRLQEGSQSEVWQDLGAGIAEQLILPCDGTVAEDLQMLQARLESGGLAFALVSPPPTRDHLQLLEASDEMPPQGSVRPLPHDVAGLVFSPTST